MGSTMKQVTPRAQPNVDTKPTKKVAVANSMGEPSKPAPKRTRQIPVAQRSRYVTDKNRISCAEAFSKGWWVPKKDASVWQYNAKNLECYITEIHRDSNNLVQAVTIVVKYPEELHGYTAKPRKVALD